MNLITTIGEDLTLLNYFLEYYFSKFCFSSYTFLINHPEHDLVCQKINEYCDRRKRVWWPSLYFEKFEGEFTEDKKVELELKYKERYISQNSWLGNNNHWFVYVDSDEFLNVPGGLDNRIKLAEQYGANYIEGKLIDRISISKSLIEVDQSKTLEEQFPIGCKMTKNICKAWDKKIVAAKYGVKVGGGHHVILNKEEYNGTFAQPYDENLSPWSFGIELHHFKWHKELINNYQRVLKTTDPSLEAWRKEYKIFFNVYDNKWLGNKPYSIDNYFIGNKIGV